MPRLEGFSDNLFINYGDFRRASIALLQSLKSYQSAGGARIQLPLRTGTHFDDVAAQLEGYARPLWAVGTLLYSGEVTEEEMDIIKPYATGLANGTDPQHPEYWGPVVLRDQRMVEMEIISFALLAAPDVMFCQQTGTAKENITEWLKTINGKDFPVTNWLWFRVLTNLALIKVCGVPAEELLHAMKADLDLMEQFYLGQGWAADGIWSDDGRQADYYSGSFAIQFSQLLYVKMAADLDPERCERFRGRAKEFLLSFSRYFDTSGAAIPFGRSLTYRFAMVGIFSAAVFAEIDLPAPLDDLGVVRGLLMRHFRWWSSKDDIFNSDGTLTIGFAYPNMYVSEDYNSPQSAYWAMKSFLALGLPKEHAFWTAKEQPLPEANNAIVQVLQPMHIICNRPNHHFLLSMGQFCPWPLKATEAKYGKFAYSSHFGFSVPTGTLLQQMAPDNTIALSKDSGDTWRVPWKVSNARFGTAQLYIGGSLWEVVPMLMSSWRPWKDADVEVQTCLVAPTDRWPDWHVRWHKIESGGRAQPIHVFQGGFAIQGRGAKLGEELKRYEDMKSFYEAQDDQDIVEGVCKTSHGGIIHSDAGTSGIRYLDIGQKADVLQQDGEILKPDANTNLMWQRTLIPGVRSEVQANATGVSIACAVLALARTPDRMTQYAASNLSRLWDGAPVVIEKVSDITPVSKDFILLGTE